MRGKPSRSFIFTPCKSSNEVSDAKNNFYRSGGGRYYLRCVDFLWLYKVHAKGCDTYAGFDSKRVSEVVCEDG